MPDVVCFAPFLGFNFGFDDIMIYHTFSYEVSADGSYVGGK